MNKPNRNLKIPFATCIGSILLVVVLLTLGQLATRPDWHAGFHALLDQSTHSDTCNTDEESPSTPDTESGCAIDLYSAGGFHFNTTPVLIQTDSSVIVTQFPAAPSDVHIAAPVNEPPGRAPPALFCL